MVFRESWSKKRSIITSPSLVRHVLVEALESGPRVAYLNMSDTGQQYPSNWTLISSPVQGCGRRNTNHRTCDSVTYSVHGHKYSHVCGRILAYQKGVAAAFYEAINGNLNNLEGAYLSGISLTHGPPDSRRHIWSFVGAAYETATSYHTDFTCPCINTDPSLLYQEPLFINNSYFCDTGNPGPETSTSTFYMKDPLWDGDGCGTARTCCEFNTPPWFCKSLPQATSDDLEIRNCYAYYSSSSDTIISLVDIYVK